MRYWAWTADEVHLMLARLTHALMLQQGLEGLTAEDRAVMLANTPVPKSASAGALDQGRLFQGPIADRAGQRAIHLRPGRGGASQPRPLARRRYVLARRHQHDRDRAPHLQLYPDRLDRSAIPKLNDWWNRTMARPAAKYVYTDGLEETPKRPPMKSIAGIAEFRV